MLDGDTQSVQLAQWTSRVNKNFFPKEEKWVGVPPEAGRGGDEGDVENF